MGVTPNLELDIGELSLDGFSHVDPISVGSTIEMELSRLLQERGLPSNFLTDRNAKQLDFGTFNLDANSGPRTIGRQIAKTIYSGFNQGNAHPSQAKEVQQEAPATSPAK